MSAVRLTTPRIGRVTVPVGQTKLMATAMEFGCVNGVVVSAATPATCGAAADVPGKTHPAAGTGGQGSLHAKQPAPVTCTLSGPASVGVSRVSASSVDGPREL